MIAGCLAVYSTALAVGATVFLAKTWGKLEMK